MRFLALVALVAAMGCSAEAQTMRYERLAELGGVTICYKGRSYSFVSTDLSGSDEIGTRAHEAKHREQYQRFANCAAFDRWYDTPRGFLESEAEAYHAGWCAVIRLGADSLERRNSFVERIDHSLGSEINRLTIIQEFLKYDPCPKEGP